MEQMPLLLRRLRRGLNIVWFEWVLREAPYLTSLERGHEARRRSDWHEAIFHFSKAMRVRPDAPGVRLHLGHAFKESGQVQQAEHFYRSAIRLAPTASDAYVHLGHALKLQGLRIEASEAYATAARIKPSDETAARELSGSRASRARRAAALGGAPPSFRAIIDAHDAIDDLNRATHQMALFNVFHPQAWPDYRTAFPVRRPPGPTLRMIVTVMIDARKASPTAIRATLMSLMEQSHEDWRALVIAPAEILQHPVASLGDVDERIRWSDGIENTSEITTAVAHVEAGTILDAHGIEWLTAALAHPARPDVIYADHDHYATRWRGHDRFDPILFASPGKRDVRTMPLPAVVIERAPEPNVIRNRHSSPLDRRGILIDAFSENKSVAHLPLVLSSKFHVEKVDFEEMASYPNIGTTDHSITIIIPTRDQAEMLKSCIDSFTELSSRPELLKFVILDNRSIENETATMMRRLSHAANVEIRPMDSPFNWSRFNNLGACNQDGDLIVFANNDLKLLTNGWDDFLRRHLDGSDVGVVGARLLYEDRTIQHAGVVLGAIGGRPIHEGRGQGAHIGGPLNRWTRTREAGAITGAFMAMRRDVFEKVGGFDETLAVAYNDIDFCLRIRSHGLRVLYAADIEAIHYESKTRGTAHSSEKVAWDDAEFETLYNLWGEAALTDPYVSPLWVINENGDFEKLRPISEAVALSALRGDQLLSQKPI